MSIGFGRRKWVEYSVVYYQQPLVHAWPPKSETHSTQNVDTYIVCRVGIRMQWASTRMCWYAQRVELLRAGSILQSTSNWWSSQMGKWGSYLVLSKTILIEYKGQILLVLFKYIRVKWGRSDYTFWGWSTKKDIGLYWGHCGQELYFPLRKFKRTIYSTPYNQSSGAEVTEYYTVILHVLEGKHFLACSGFSDCSWSHGPG